MFDSISDTAFWSTSAEVIAGLVVAIVFADLATTTPLRLQVRWYATLQWAALVAIAGGLAASLLALADEQLRQTWAAVVVIASVAILGGVVGVRITKLHEQARDQARRRTGARSDPE
jgi:cytochrome bd-type quinol oxidase subunit 2